MGRHEKRIARLLRKSNDATIRFDDLRELLRSLGFRERIRGSHHRFDRAGIPELINLQRDGAAAKPYQVRQVRRLLTRHRLTDVRSTEEP
jgi:hypothetical protein